MALVDAMNASDSRPLPRRHVALLLLVFLMPSGVLTALAVRTFTQDRELAVRRQEDGRRQLATAIRREFITRLDGLKIRALSAAVEPAHGNHDPADAILLVAKVEDGRLLLPWDRPMPPDDAVESSAEHPFTNLIARGEAAEMVQQRPVAAAALYRQALASARTPSQGAAAELLVARSLLKAGRAADALVYTRRTLARPLALVDEQGVPFALYAARGLVDLPAVDADDARTALSLARDVADARGMGPAAVYMAASVASNVKFTAPGAIEALAAATRDATSAAIERTEQALALQQTFPALARQFPSVTRPAGESLWLPFGARPWLVALSTGIASGQPTLIAIDAHSAFEGLESAAACTAAGGCRLALVSDNGPDDYPLGAALPGLKLTGLTAFEAPDALRSVRWFYLAAISLVLALAAFAAYMLWRDVRRELRVAELRSQFVSSVSHELKTPLTAIRMFAETLRMGRPADPVRRDEYLDTIVNESERLTRLLNNVLDFSRIERGRKSYQFAPHDLPAIVDLAARAMQYPLAQQGFELSVDADAEVPLVRSDADAIEQAILNLLANALKYSGDSRKIELRLARDETHAVISVRDWGIGIAAADHRRIFEKFYRVATPENRHIPGTGLGLTLVDHIARAHGGFVDLDSSPSAGSTFRLHLPLGLLSSASDDRMAPAETHHAAATEV